MWSININISGENTRNPAFVQASRNFSYNWNLYLPFINKIHSNLSINGLFDFFIISDKMSNPRNGSITMVLIRNCYLKVKPFKLDTKNVFSHEAKVLFTSSKGPEFSPYKRTGFVHSSFDATVIYLLRIYVEYKYICNSVFTSYLIHIDTFMNAHGLRVRNPIWRVRLQ